ncbi:MAG: FAD-dependent oxidoreductase [bacterium]|nr:FAD-dependent oxidoreductase [bacterium]
MKQVSLKDLAGTSWDVVIVGAGPAGTTCANYLLRSGHAVLLVDTERFPREKPCGDVLGPIACRELERLGLLNQLQSIGTAIPGITCISPRGTEINLAGSWLSVKRSSLDELLLSSVPAKPGRFGFALGRLVCKPGEGSLPLCDTSEIERSLGIKCLFAVWAAGCRTSSGAKKTTGPTPGRGKAVAVQRYLESTYRLPQLYVKYNRALMPGYFWIFPSHRTPSGTFLYNVGCGAPLWRLQKKGLRLSRVLKEQIETDAMGSRLLDTGGYTSSLRSGIINTDFQLQPPGQSSNVAIVGEASGTTLPFTWEGIGPAMQSGRIVAGALSVAPGGDLTISGRGNGAKGFREMRKRHQQFTWLERFFSRPWLTDVLARRIVESDHLKSVVTASLQGDRSPTAFIRPGTLLKSLFR